MNPAGRFLIVSWDGGGNTPPALNLGARLVDKGHQVRLLGWDSMAERAAAAGVEFATYPSVPPLSASVTLEDVWEERVLPALGGDATTADIVAAANEFAADVLVVDCMMSAGLEAVNVLGLPAAVLMHLLDSFFAQVQGERVTCLLGDVDEVLALVPPGFDASCPLPANTSCVGPITAPHSRQPLDPHDAQLLARPGDPWVLVSLSTTLQGQAAALPRILDAVATVPVRVLLTLGGVLPSRAVDGPPNVTIREFVPHDLVLRHMAVVVSHGGLGTITSALAAGVPLVCIPQGRDQYANAARVTASGVGRTVATDAPAAAIAAALTQLLEDTAARRAVRRFADIIVRLGGGDVATDKIVALRPPAKIAPRQH